MAPDGIGSADGPDGRAEGGQSSFESVLREHRERGASLLVTGALPSDVYTRACRKYVGAVGSDPRRRVFVLVGRGPETVERVLPVGANRDPGHLQIVSSGGARGEAATGDSRDPNRPGAPRPGVGFDDVVLTRTTGVGELGAEAATAIEGMARRAGTLGPSELRVCMDSLAPLFDTMDDDRVGQFVHLLGTQVRHHRGQVYFFLPTSREDPRVAALEALVDVVIELRMSQGRLEECWQIPGGPASGWMPVDVDR